MIELGFRLFVGVDGSKGMLEQAANTCLYQDLRLALLGRQPLPAQPGTPHTLSYIQLVTLTQTSFQIWH